MANSYVLQHFYMYIFRINTLQNEIVFYFTPKHTYLPLYMHPHQPPELCLSQIW